MPSGEDVKDPGNVTSREANSAGPGATSTGLVDGVKGRDPEAWRRLAHLYGPLVYQWCRWRGLQTSDAEDVTQDVFLTVAARVGSFRRDRPGDTFRGWLWAITRHKLGHWIRRQRAQEQPAGGTDAQQRLQAEPLPEEGSGSADAGDAGAVAGLYRRALELIRTEFEDRSWEAFRRLVIEGQRPADVAADLGMTRGAVYVTKSRILRRLREVLGDAP
jgi:RNA polymerase sigma-70 factor (ECF subfamily)